MTVGNNAVGEAEFDHTLLHRSTCMPGMNPPENAVEVARLLLESGADVNARARTQNPGKNGETPLHWSASVGHAGLVDLLVKAGADIEADGAVICNASPLFEAAVFGNLEAAETLLRHGAAFNIVIAAAMGRLDLLETLFDRDGNVIPGAYSLPCWKSFDESPQVSLDDSFYNACARGHLPVVQYLFERGANPAERGPTGNFPLEEAEENGHREVVQWLREVLNRKTD